MYYYIKIKNEKVEQIDNKLEYPFKFTTDTKVF